MQKGCSNDDDHLTSDFDVDDDEDGDGEEDGDEDEDDYLALLSTPKSLCFFQPGLKSSTFLSQDEASGNAL